MSDQGPAAVPGAPGPPPGPGVQPPFVAPPVEGRRARIGLGLGLAGGLLAICCAGGGVATVGVLVLGERAINEQAQRAADDYLAAVAEQDWEQAHDLRCERDQAAESLTAFSRRMAGQPRIESYEVGRLATEGGPFDQAEDGRLSVPAEVSYADGTDTVLEIPIDQNPETGLMEVCGTVTDR